MHGKVGPKFLPPPRRDVAEPAKAKGKAPAPPPRPAAHKEVSKEELRGMQARDTAGTRSSTSLFNTQVRATKERGQRFEPKGKGRVTPSHSRHQRKDLRALKAQGVHPWESQGLQIREATPKAPPAPVDPSEGPMKARVAASFAATLRELGFDAYASGGAALSWHGGGRPVDDLDFRIRYGDHGVGTFDDPQGRALVAALNDRGRALRAAGFDVGEFRALGGGGLTVVCDDYCGVEVSISLMPKEQQTVRLRPTMDDVASLTAAPGDAADRLMHADSTAVLALSLRELQADKMKSLISRWKWGTDNIKKTSQDLYDLLNAIVLDDGKVPDAIHRAVDARVDEYTRSNPFHTKLDHVPDRVLKEELLAFTVLLAKEHTKGSRKEAFNKLCGADETHGRAVGEALAQLCKVRPDPDALSAVRPWVAEWRDREGPTGRRMPVELEPIHRGSGVEDILAKGVFDVDPIETGRASKDQVMQVLTVLIDGDGFRALDDSSNGFQTQLAFGLSPNQFGHVYSALKKAGFVQGHDDGLHLTPAGRRLCDL